MLFNVGFLDKVEAHLFLIIASVLGSIVVHEKWNGKQKKRKNEKTEGGRKGEVRGKEERRKMEEVMEEERTEGRNREEDWRGRKE